jgi:heme/copper-type cytochrome/quinol oxidase subunit 2
MKRRPLVSRSLGLLAFVVALCGMASVASACPSCQAALANDGAQADLARGIYYSILFMMSMPFAIVGTFGCLMYRAVKREQRRVDEAKSQDKTS